MLVRGFAAVATMRRGNPAQAWAGFEALGTGMARSAFEATGWPADRAPSLAINQVGFAMGKPGRAEGKTDAEVGKPG